MPTMNFFLVSASVNQRDMEKASDLFNFSESDLVPCFPNAFFFFKLNSQYFISLQFVPRCIICAFMCMYIFNI